MVHAVCLEELQEYDTTSCSWKSLTFDESREFIETLLVSGVRLVHELLNTHLIMILVMLKIINLVYPLLQGPAAKAPFIQAVNWKPGDFVIFDNVQLQHRYMCVGPRT